MFIIINPVYYIICYYFITLLFSLCDKATALLQNDVPMSNIIVLLKNVDKHEYSLY